MRPFQRGTRELSDFLGQDASESVFDMPTVFSPTVRLGVADEFGTIQSRLQHWMLLTGVNLPALFATAVVVAGRAGCWAGPLINYAGNVNVQFNAVSPVIANAANITDNREDQNIGSGPGASLGFPPALFAFGSGIGNPVTLLRGTTVTHGTNGIGITGLLMQGATTLFTDSIFIPPGGALILQAGVVAFTFNALLRLIEPLVYYPVGGTP